MFSKIKRLTLSSTNLSNRAERAAFFEQEEGKAGERVKQAFAKLQKQGILDKAGSLLPKDLPADMKPDSNCDVGG
jgi:hypothetical protein